jgi:hypothetical protein
VMLFSLARTPLLSSNKIDHIENTALTAADSVAGPDRPGKPPPDFPLCSHGSDRAARVSKPRCPYGPSALRDIGGHENPRCAPEFSMERSSNRTESHGHGTREGTQPLPGVRTALQRPD